MRFFCGCGGKSWGCRRENKKRQGLGVALLRIGKIWAWVLLSGPEPIVIADARADADAKTSAAGSVSD
jgi:hypothetical protein